MVGYDALLESQSDTVINMVYFTAGGFPVITLLVSCFFIMIYNVDEESLKKKEKKENE